MSSSSRDASNTNFDNALEVEEEHLRRCVDAALSGMSDTAQLVKGSVTVALLRSDDDPDEKMVICLVDSTPTSLRAVALRAEVKALHPALFKGKNADMRISLVVESSRVWQAILAKIGGGSQFSLSAAKPMTVKV